MLAHDFVCSIHMAYRSTLTLLTNELPCPVQLCGNLRRLWCAYADALSLQLAGSEAVYGDLLRHGRCTPLGRVDDLGMKAHRCAHNWLVVSALMSVHTCVLAKLLAWLMGCLHRMRAVGLLLQNLASFVIPKAADSIN